MINQSVIELCRKALSIDSSIVNGTTEFTEFLIGLSDDIGMKVQSKNYLFRDLDFQNLLITQNTNHEEIKYLFVNPLDTEAPGPFRAWTLTGQDPFDITIRDGKMYGLGANCGKLNSVLLLKALSELPEEQRQKFALLGTYGREVRAHGAIRFLKEQNILPSSSVVGFPTSNQVVHAQAGRIRMRINFPFTDEEKELKSKHDEQEHSSSESQYFHSKTDEENNGTEAFGRSNAITDALHFIENLPDQLLVLDFAGGKDLYSDPRSCLFEFDLVSGHNILMGVKLKKFIEMMSMLNKEFKKYSNKDFSPEHSLIHLGRVVCDLEGIEFWGECIFPPGIPEVVSDEWINKLREEIESIGGTSKLLSQRWPYIYKGEKTFIDQLLKLNDSNKPQSLSYTSEADLFERVGFQSLVYGPGEFGQMFKPNEYVSVKSLEHALNFYKKILIELC